VTHIPLCGQRKVVVPNLREIALFPFRAVNQRNVDEFEESVITLEHGKLAPGDRPWEQVEGRSL
jgi:hypothetical protein